MQKHIQPLTERHPAIMGLVSATAGFIRNISIKPYKSRKRDHEMEVRARFRDLPSVLCRIYKEKGAGQKPTIIIGGFVPDATEALEFQRPLLRSFGSIYYINYPRTGFSAEMFNAQLEDLLEDLYSRRKLPVLMGISFGAGLLVDFLRKSPETTHSKIKGVMLVSPVLCTQDLVRPEGEKSGGVRMLESNLRKIIKSDPSDPFALSKQVDRARRCFTGLFEAGAGNRQLSARHLAIRRKIFGVIENTSAMGGYQRVLALRDFKEPESDSTVYGGQALVIKAEDEKGILVPSSPTLAMLDDSSNLRRFMPRAVMKTAVSKETSDPVPHASLIFHHQCFNPLLEAWLNKIHSELLWAVA